MAVAPMLKATVIGYRPVADDVVEALQHAGVVQIEATSFELPSDEIAPDDARARGLEEQAAEAHFVRDFLSHYHVNGQPFSAFVSEKFHLDRDEFRSLHFDPRVRRLYRECLSISDKLASGERERERLGQLLKDLEPWEAFRYQIHQWRGTESTVLFTGTVAAAESPRIHQLLRDEIEYASVEEQGAVGGRQAWVVVAHRCCAAEARALLAANDFAEVRFPDLTDYPAEEMARARQRIADLAEEADGLHLRATKLADEHFHRVVALVEAIDSGRDRLSVRRDFARTERAFVATGWVDASEADALEAALAPFVGDVDLTLDEPGEGDDPPVRLRNRRLLRPFEVLTDLYGPPSYGELDPTPLLAPFFLIFFGICISDVGYGAMLIGGAWWVKNRIDVAPGVKRFCDLLMLGGVAAMVFGVLFASYFALPVDVLPPFLASLQVLDPLNELTTFLLFTLVLGIIQVFFGVFIAAYDSFRRGDASEAVFGQLSIVFMFVMIGAYAVTGQALLLSAGLLGTMLMQGRAIQAAVGDSSRALWDRLIGWLWIAAVLAAIVLMGVGQVSPGLLLLAGASILGAIVSKSARAAVLGLLGGAYAVYGMSAFVGDTLSYTRLAALGLSGALVGFVFNVLAGLVMEPAAGLFSQGGMAIVGGVLITVLAATIFVVGHTFNVVINLLGAFVHPARLQFVEFFSKFYEAGGRPFAPFSMRSSNLVLEAGDAGSEGGAG